MDNTDYGSSFKIGALAHKLDINPKTIRYYEKIGLLPVPRRSPAGYRLYGQEAYERLRFILKGKAIGLSLNQIGEILALREEGRAPCQHVVSLLDDKIAAVDEHIAALTEFRQDLVVLREAASEEAQPHDGFCRIIDQYEASHPRDPLPDSITGLRFKRKE